MTLHAIYVGS